MVHILDISFGFHNGNLVTDIFRKDTDSRGSLHFSSCHPNHVFSGIVYSQALRLRRIINKDDIFHSRLEELKIDFIAASYPLKLINNIFDKVKNLPRHLEKKQKKMESKSAVILTSTYGRDRELKKIVQESCEPQKIPIQYVSKTGAKLKNIVSNLKQVSLGKKHGISAPCCQRLCKTCNLMSGKCEIINSRNKKFKTSKGNCKSRNCIYCATCNICHKNYVGKSTQPEHKRINGHRTDMKKYMDNPGILNVNSDVSEKERYSLATHLHNEHNKVSQNGLDDHYNFTILEKCTPKSLDLKEHLWVQKLKSLSPFGINLNSPLGFPLKM